MYVLMQLIISVTYVPTLGNFEFASFSACEAAKQAIIRDYSARNVMQHSKSISLVCVSTGKSQ